MNFIGYSGRSYIMPNYYTEFNVPRHDYSLETYRGWKFYYSAKSLVVVDTYFIRRYSVEDITHIFEDIPNYLPKGIKQITARILGALRQSVIINLPHDQSGLNDNYYGIELECFYPASLGDRENVCREIRNRGINISYQGYTHHVLNTWKMVTDSSLRCNSNYFTCEIVSPKLKGSEGFTEINKLCKILDDLGFGVNASCGFHVHHDATNMSSTDRLKVFDFYRKNEYIFDSITARSRRGDANDYCHSLRFRNGGDAYSFPRGRYYKVNPESFSKYGTIEFRQHQGTLNYKKIANWIRLTQRVVEKSGLFGECNNINQMLDNLDLSVYSNYFVSRIEELA